MTQLDVSMFFSSPKALLAPMAGVTDQAFRRLCREQGADLTFTEMVSAKGLSYANEKTRHLIDIQPDEGMVSVQIFGHEPDVMAKEAAWVEDELGERLVSIDINMGCPVRKMVTKGDGAALMETPELACAIVSAVASAVDHPVSAKIRRGVKLGVETAPDLARRLEDAGAVALTVHGRFARQLYRGSADWGVIRRVAEVVDIPVIGNGDVTNGDRALAMVQQTGCASVMIARGAEGNPWVFADAAAALNGNPRPRPPTALERIDMARRHATLLDGGDGNASLTRMRKHAMWYVAGMTGASLARQRFNHCVTLADFNAVFDELRERAKEDTQRTNRELTSDEA